MSTLGELVARFWLRVNKDGPLPASKPELGPCWLWTGETNRFGYGLFNVQSNPRKRKMAHTFLYEATNGVLPKGMVPDHLCRVRNCVRLEHLEPVTDQVNTLRGVGPTAMNARKTHCKRGHLLSPNNLYSPPGRIERWCRICSSARKHRRHE